MPDNKKHHYVPQLYLRCFSNDKKNVPTFIIRSLKVIPNAPIKSQCYRDYFYGNEPDFEHVLGIAEGRASTIFKEISENNRLPSDPAMMFDLLLYVLAQNGRTSKEVERLNDMTNQYAKHIMRRWMEERGVPAYPPHRRRNTSLHLTLCCSSAALPAYQCGPSGSSNVRNSTTGRCRPYIAAIRLLHGSVRI